MLNRISTISDQNTEAFGAILSLWVTQRHHATSMLYLCLSIRDAVSKSNASLFAFHIEKSSPQGEALFPPPQPDSPTPQQQSPRSSPGPFLGATRVCLCFAPSRPSAFFWGGGTFPAGWVLFPLRTPRVCVALSPRHNAPLHFLGRGWCGRQISAERSRRGRGSPEGIGDRQSPFSTNVSWGAAR